MLRTGSGSIIICPRIRENLTMENGDAGATWRIWSDASRITAEMQGNVANGDPAVHLVRTISPTIYPRNQGDLRNGERFPGLGSGRCMLEQMHHLVDRWAMQ